MAISVCGVISRGMRSCSLAIAASAGDWIVHESLRRTREPPPRCCRSAVGTGRKSRSGLSTRGGKPAAASKSAVVVKEQRRAHFGKILVTVHGLSLYYLPSGSCTGSCLSIWPPLEMPAGKTKPKGASCLATRALGHKLQVTYRKHRLYTFSGDSGTSVNGNGVSGFKVAKVVKCG
jgi:predicted lipoprotein with Yx(FWY)xxD motif